MSQEIPEIYLIKESLVTNYSDLEDDTSFKLSKKIEDINLQIRSINGLQVENINYVGDLVQYTEEDLKRFNNLGRKSIEDIKEALSDMGLKLGLEISDHLNDQIKEYKKKIINKKLIKEPLTIDQLSFLIKNPRDSLLPQRAINALLNFGCKNMGDVLEISERELKRSQSLGKVSIAAIKKKFYQFNINLDDKLEPWNEEVISKIEDLVKEKNKINNEKKYTDKFENLEEELSYVINKVAITSFNKNSALDRYIDIFKSRYGLDGNAPKTLEIIGQKYNVTRERVRQIQKTFERMIRKIDFPFIIFNQCLETIKDNAPFTEEEINNILKNKKITTIDYDIESLINLSELFSLTFPKLEKIKFNKINIFHYQNTYRSINKIVVDIKRCVSRSGVCNINFIKNHRKFYSTDLSLDIIFSVIKRFENFNWIDSNKEWFTFYSRRSRLINLIAKVITSNSKIELSTLHKAVNRNYRLSRDFILNESNFLNYCKIAFDIEVKDKEIEFKSIESKISLLVGRLGKQISEKESILIDVFKQYGPILLYEDLHDLLLLNGVGIDHINQFIAYSPIIGRIDQSTYTLTGAKYSLEGIKKIRIDLATKYFNPHECDFLEGEKVFVEVNNYEKYVKDLVYPRILRKIDNETKGIRYNGKIYPIID